MTRRLNPLSFSYWQMTVEVWEMARLACRDMPETIKDEMDLSDEYFDECYEEIKNPDYAGIYSTTSNEV